MYTKKKERYALRGLYVQENRPNDTPSNNVSNISKQEILVTILSLKWIITVTEMLRTFLLLKKLNLINVFSERWV